MSLKTSIDTLLANVDAFIAQLASLTGAVNTAANSATEAATSAANAAAVVTGGTAQLTPAAGKIPLSDANTVIDAGWVSGLVKFGPAIQKASRATYQVSTTATSDPTTYYKIAMLPVAAVTSSEQLLLRVLITSGIAATGREQLMIVMGRKGGFSASTLEYHRPATATAYAANAYVYAYQNAAGSVDVYLVTKTGFYSALTVEALGGGYYLTATLIAPHLVTGTTVAPTGGTALYSSDTDYLNALFSSTPTGHAFKNALSVGTGLTLTTGNMLPGIDNLQLMGDAAHRWATIFAGSGVINTSDARQKTPVSPLSTAELAASRDIARLIGRYQFLDAVAQKGNAARVHCGLTVQAVIAALENHGLKPFGYAFICYNSWPDAFLDHPADGDNPAWREQTQTAGDSYGLRMDELLAFVAAGFEARLSAAGI